MKHLKLSAAIVLVICSFTLNAQTRPINKIEILSGDISALKDIKNVNIAYDYSHVQVGEYSEADYLKKRRGEAENPYDYEEFKAEWFSNRQDLYEPRFEKLFNKLGEKSGIRGYNNGKSGSSVTLKVEVLYMDPGFYAGPVTKGAFCDFKCSFVQDDGKVLMVYMLSNVMGAKGGYSPVNFSNAKATSRFAESYAKAGKMLMHDINKKLQL